MAARESVLAELAGGDTDRGRELAAFITDRSMSILVEMVLRDGVKSCGDVIEIVARAARNALGLAENPLNEMVEP